MRSGGLLLTTLVAALVAAAPAQAGTFSVYACGAAGTVWDNRSWTVESPVGGIGSDDVCPDATQNIDLHVSAGARTADGREALLIFRAPSGTTIADFRLNRRLNFDHPVPSGHHRYYAIYALGSSVFAGAGNYNTSVENRLRSLGSWYGDSSDTGLGVVSRASFRSLAGYAGNATTLSLRVGCFARGTPCGMAAGGRIDHNLRGAEIILNDPRAPTNLLVDASGLLAGGQRNGNDPVRLRVSDSTGIRRVELVDVTDPAAPQVVGAEDYAASGRTDRGSGCSFRLRKPCPDLTTRENLLPTALTVGRKRLVVRAFDAGGNVAQRGPYDVDVITPSNRGPLNGTGATEGGTLSLRLGSGSGRRATRRTLGYNRKITLHGTLRNERGEPVPNAQVELFSRDLDDDDYRLRATLTTDAEGRVAYRATAFASRLYQLAWRSHVNDTRAGVSAYATLRARADGRIRVSPSRPRVGERVVIRGRLLGKRPRRAVDLVAQGRQGSGSYQTFANARAGRRGTFRLVYRFRSAASRGRAFTFRVRIGRSGAYETGYSNRVRVRVR